MFDAKQFFNAKMENESQAQEIETRYYAPEPESFNFVAPTSNSSEMVEMFSSTLLMTNLGQQYIQSMVDVIDYENKNEIISSGLTSERNTYVTDKNLHERHNSVKQLLETAVNVINDKYSISTNISKSWLNINNPGGFEFKQNQEGFLTGLFFVNVPSDSNSDVVLHNPSVGAIHQPEAQKLNERYMMITPESGDLIVFPSWVPFHVEQNMSESNLISIRFNVLLK